MKTEEEDGHLEARERGLRSNQHCEPFDLGLQAPREENIKPVRK